MILHIHLRSISCPHCRRLIEIRVWGLSSGLGPSVLCASCGKPVSTDRSEWPHMSWGGKGWYVGVSLLYATVVALGAGAVTGSFASALHRVLGQRVEDPMVPIHEATLAWGASILVLQAARVVWSSRRVASGEWAQPRPNLLDLDSFLPAKVLVAMLVLAAIGMTISGR